MVPRLKLVCLPNGISIGSTVFRRAQDRDQHTDRPCHIVCSNRPHSRCAMQYTRKHTFNGLFSRSTQVSHYQKVKPIRISLKQETVSGSGISWAIRFKSAPHSRQTTMPAPHHSGFYRPDALPAAQPTTSKH